MTPVQHDVGRLVLWKRLDNTISTVASDVSLSYFDVVWSHHGQRLLFARGRTNFMRYPAANPVLTVFDAASSTLRTFAHGTFASWSPDDRLVGYSKLLNCGASACFGDQMIVSSSGGVPVTLLRNVMDDFLSESWAMRNGGYAYDRWLLGPRGHIQRRLVSMKERVDGWSPDGRALLVQSVHPYAPGPITFSLLTTAGWRHALVTTAWTGGCGACSRVFLDAGWNHAGTRFTVLKPGVYTNSGRTTIGTAFVGDLTGALVHIPVVLREQDETSLVGFAQSDSLVVLQVRHILYRYDLAAKTLNVLARNVDLGSATVIP
jgi:hypothetical protein